MTNLALFDDAPKESKKSEHKGGFSAHQYKMINWYAEAHGFRLALATPPNTINFIVKMTGDREAVDLTDIKDAYKSAKREEAQERARNRRAT